MPDQEEHLDYGAMARRRAELLEELYRTKPGMAPLVRESEAMRILLTENNALLYPQARARYEIEGANIIAEQARKWAREETARIRAEYRQAAGTVRQDLAKTLRERADNPHWVRGKQRREGVLLAAEWLDPTS